MYIYDRKGENTELFNFDDDEVASVPDTGLG